MQVRQTIFLEKDDFFHKYQFGFREHYSTELSATYLVNKITAAIESNEATLGVLLHLNLKPSTLLIIAFYLLNSIIRNSRYCS